MDNMQVMRCVINSATSTDKTIFDVLFTEQLPATLTFIAAILGIMTQILIGWVSLRNQRKLESRKYKMDCIRNFYIHMMSDLIGYDTNIKILNCEIDDLNLFNSNDTRLKDYSSNLQLVYQYIKNISSASFDHYFPINKKLNKETMSMLSYMMKASKVLDLPIDEREKLCGEIEIPKNGYNTSLLIKLINKYIK